MSLQSLPVGFVLSDRYEIQKVLGAGGMGAVYLAFDRALSETVAIKVLRKDREQTPEAARRFLSEIKLARTVTHKNVCRIYEYGTDGGLSYISMAFVDGTDLRRLIGERGRLGWEQAFDIAIQVADGLQAIHEEGIVHRDLKTPNIMVDGRGVVRLMDFGIAKHWEGAESAALTVAGAIVGTPEYMSPEQVRGERIDQRSDIYALGVVVFEMFTGRPPFRGETPVATILKHLNDAPPLEGPGAESLPPALVGLLRRALAKDPADRFASAGELRAALQEARIAGSGSPSTAAAVTAGAAAARAPTLSSPPTAVPHPAPRRTAAARVPSAGTSVGVWIAGGMLALAAVALATVVVLVVRRTNVSHGPLPSARPSAVPAVPSPGVSVTPRPPTPSATAVTAAASPLAARPSPGRPSAAPALHAAPDPALDGLLAEAEGALASQQYDMALAFYAEALKKDPGNPRATVGRDLALQARRAQAEGPASRGRTFIQGTSRWVAPPSVGPRGFEDSAMVARRVDQAAPLPGAIHFEVTPAAVGPGDDYRLTVSLINESFSAIQIRDVHVATSLNGRTAAGPVSPKVRFVPPRQKAALFEIADRWKADTASWSMAVTVTTERGEAFTNEATWR